MNSFFHFGFLTGSTIIMADWIRAPGLMTLAGRPAKSRVIDSEASKGSEEMEATT